MVKTSKFLCFWHLWTPKDPLSGVNFFCLRFAFAKNRKKKIMKEIAKKKSKLWACSAYGGTPDRQNTRLLRFFALFGAQKPYSGVKIFPGKKIFFSRFFKNRLVFGKNHEISGARNHVLGPHRCSKVSNFAFNGLKSSKLALFRAKKKIRESLSLGDNSQKSEKKKKMARFPDLARSGQIWGVFFFFEKKNFPDSQIWPDLARSGNKISTSGKRARSGKLAPKSGQIWQHPCFEWANNHFFLVLYRSPI